DITIRDIGTVAGMSQTGITARSYGGDIVIQGVGRTGGISGTSRPGIYVDTGSKRTSTGTITIGGTGEDALGNVSGGTIGIAAGSVLGGISITTANVIGMANHGVSGQIGTESYTESTADIAIDTTAGMVSGGADGIRARNYGTGAAVVMAGNVTAIGAGIFTRTRSGANITLASGAAIRGSGVSIRTEESVSGATPSDRITLMGAATGAVQTNAGDDVVTLMDGGSFGSFDGGDGSDRLEFAQTTGVLNTAFVGTLSNIETIAITAGTTTASGVFSSPDIMVATAATLDLADGLALAADLTNMGGLSVAGTGTGAVGIAGALTLSAGGTLTLDAGASLDSLTVSGAVTLGGNLVVRPVAGLTEG
ncbi:MAG: hypothetical protein K8953_02830, partial [Proteobacteria bacterium]|nr:hypothetical protein [Pseudomonadota bacterium]